jgi:hypothetical protein
MAIQSGTDFNESCWNCVSDVSIVNFLLVMVWNFEVMSAWQINMWESVLVEIVHRIDH